MSEPFLGEIKLVGFNFAPRGYSFCNGALLPISQNTALFSLLGTFYGGDGQSTFKLPDLRSRIPVGQGQGLGLSSYDIGEVGGTENTTLLTSNMPAHTHMATSTLTASTTISATTRSTSKTSSPAGNLPTVGTLEGASTFLLSYSAATDGTVVAMAPQMAATTGTVTTTNTATGGSIPFSNLQPYLAVNYVIALQGVFPSRNWSVFNPGFAKPPADSGAFIRRRVYFSGPDKLGASAKL